jgi:fructose-1,6-bisphosphatase/inositol monophosphatase family enzyme
MHNSQNPEHIVTEALKRALKTHDTLAEKGEEEIQKNQFGDTAVRADIECENAVLEYLKEIRFPIHVISEEHGTVDITKDPHYLGILDGLDGSSVYKAQRGIGRYGTMFGIFANIDPIYEDYLVSGVMEHTTKRMFIAVKGGGAHIFVQEVKTPIRSSERTELLPDTNIYIDEYFEINRKIFSSKLQAFKPASHPFYTGSSAVHYVDVACGEADLALECTRKNNLEIAVAYGIETEAGAVMVDMEGVSIGNRKYLAFGQEEKLPIITAASHKLARALLEHIRS